MGRAMCVKVIWKRGLAICRCCWRKLQSSFVEEPEGPLGTWAVSCVELGEQGRESHDGFQRGKKKS